MTTKSTVPLELDDIQAGALEPRPVPYAGIYQILRLDDRHAGRELLRRLIPYLDSVASFDPKIPVSLAVAVSFHGLKALGVPEESLATFPPEFRQGMAARAAELGIYHLTRSVGDISNSGIFKVFYYFRLNYISIYFVSSNKWLAICTKHN